MLGRLIPEGKAVQTEDAKHESAKGKYFLTQGTAGKKGEVCQQLVSLFERVEKRHTKRTRLPLWDRVPRNGEYAPVS